MREEVEGHVLPGGPAGEEVRRADLCWCGGGGVLVWFGLVWWLDVCGVMWCGVVWSCVVLFAGCVGALDRAVGVCWFGMGFVGGVHICRRLLVWCGHTWEVHQ